MKRHQYMLSHGKEVARCEEEAGLAGDQGLAEVEDGEEVTPTPSAAGSPGCPDGGGLMG